MPEDIGIYKLEITLTDNGEIPKKSSYSLTLNVTTAITVKTDNITSITDDLSTPQKDIDEYFLFNKEFQAKIRSI